MPAAVLCFGALVMPALSIAQSAEDRAEWPKTDFSRRTVNFAEI